MKYIISESEKASILDLYGIKYNEPMPLEKLSTCKYTACLLYTSDAADDLLCVDLVGRRII